MLSAAATQNPPASDLAAAPPALHALTTATDRLVTLAAATPDDPASSFHRVVTLVHDLCAALVDAEAAGCTRQELREAARTARDIHGASPFVRRLQEWPRGYPGDFETIEWLCRATNEAPEGTLASALER